MDHPSTERLRHWQFNLLQGEETDAIAAHLNICPECSAQLDGMSPFEDELAHLPVAELIESPEWVGQTVLGYRVDAEAGRGGSGVVYKAADPGLKRHVALKTLSPSALADPGLRARFRNDADALTRLEHPNIIRVYHHGEHQGHPVLVMEFAEGGSLAQILAQDDGKVLCPPHESAVLIELLAGAAHHAHAKRIIHRDLTPGNILLVPAPETPPGIGGLPATVTLRGQRLVPKITDFNLVKFTDDDGGRTPCTLQGEALGTPQYMSPEAARGDGNAMSNLTDVYGLGAILYQLLTGKPPFTGASSHEIVDKVLKEPPDEPRRLAPKVPRDLETICLHCLKKKPGERYDTAKHLAEDLGRYRRGETIEARPVGSAERLWRWCRRKPGLAAAALLAFMAPTVAGISVAVVSVKAAERIDAARQVAERNAEDRRVALKLANASLDAAVNKITQNEKLRDRGFFELRKELLESVLPHYRDLAALQSDDPEVEAARAGAYGKMGLIHYWLGQKEESFRDNAEMESVFASLIARHPDVASYQLAAATCYNDLAVLLSERGEMGRAKAAFDRGDQMAGVLVRDHPDGVDHHLVRLNLHHNRCLWFYQQGRTEDALEEVRRALDFEKEAEERFPGNADCRVLRGNLLTDRGQLHFDRGRFGKAEQAHREALDVLQPLGDLPSATPEQRVKLADAWSGLGIDLCRLKRYGESRDASAKALALYKRLNDESPNVPAYGNDVAKTLHNLAHAGEALGDTAAATRLRRQSLEIFEKLAAGYPLDSSYQEDLGRSYCSMGGHEFDQGRYGTALEWLDRAVAIWEPLSKHPRHAVELRAPLRNLYEGRGQCLAKLGRYVEALDQFDRAQALEYRWFTGILRGAAHTLLRQEILPALRLARAGDHVKATAAATALVKGPNAHPEMDYNAAGVFGICATKVKDKDALAAEGYAVQAVALLKNAQAGGLFKDPRLLKDLQTTDHDLDALRQRPDFKQVVDEATGKGR